MSLILTVTDGEVDKRVGTVLYGELDVKGSDQRVTDSNPNPKCCRRQCERALIDRDNASPQLSGSHPHHHHLFMERVVHCVFTPRKCIPQLNGDKQPSFRTTLLVAIEPECTLGVFHT